METPNPPRNLVKFAVPIATTGTSESYYPPNNDENGDPFVGSFARRQSQTPSVMISGDSETPDKPTGEGEPNTLMNPSDGEKPGHEIPFTDSGYATARLGGPQSPIGRDNREDNSDARTYISATTTVVPVVVQHSISEVCDDIYRRVQQHVGEDNKNLLDGMPDLIKAFAIRLAHLDPSDANRRIMHFVYSHHRRVLPILLVLTFCTASNC
jgi:hypothetical protein